MDPAVYFYAEPNQDLQHSAYFNFSAFTSEGLAVALKFACLTTV